MSSVQSLCSFRSVRRLYANADGQTPSRPRTNPDSRPTCSRLLRTPSSNPTSLSYVLLLLCSSAAVRVLVCCLQGAAGLTSPHA
jgi:hypothetical protein